MLMGPLIRQNKSVHLYYHIASLQLFPCCITLPQTLYLHLCRKSVSPPSTVRCPLQSSSFFPHCLPHLPPYSSFSASPWLWSPRHVSLCCHCPLCFVFFCVDFAHCVYFLYPFVCSDIIINCAELLSSLLVLLSTAVFPLFIWMVAGNIKSYDITIDIINMLGHYKVTLYCSQLVITWKSLFPTKKVKQTFTVNNQYLSVVVVQLIYEFGSNGDKKEENIEF